MVSFRCTLTADAAHRLSGALNCLAKFSEVLGLDVNERQMVLIALSATKTSSASIMLDSRAFFQSFRFQSNDTDDDDDGNNLTSARERLSPSSDVAADSFGPYGNNNNTNDTSRRPPGSGSSAPASRSFQCQLFNRSLLSVFKPRGSGGTGGGASSASASVAPASEIPADSGIERCEIALQNDDGLDARLVVTMVSRAGVRKTVRLTYEDAAVARARFDRSGPGASSHWTMGAHVLKGFTEFFGARTELLDIYSEGTGRGSGDIDADDTILTTTGPLGGSGAGNGRAFFTSYTEKVTKASSGEVLRQPLQTTVDVDVADFDEFDVDDGMHVGLSVRDFRAVVVHADALRATVTAHYSRPRLPLQLVYADGRGVSCEFTLATTGQMAGAGAGATAAAAGLVPSRPATAAGALPAVASSARATPARESRSLRPVDLATKPTAPAVVRNSFGPQTASRQSSAMPPPQASRQASAAARAAARPPPTAPSASVDEQSLFIPENEDDDQRWDETSYDMDEDQIGWNDSYVPDQTRTLTQSSVTRDQLLAMQTNEFPENEVPPTQPMGHMRGLFD